ncbi:MAG: tRNA-dihydrouridine synthase family protein [Kiritimatiellae bacterium]|nr:tRNA-dihydrouridine synthase family protein [Kiritimatiellia bacterium]
MILAPLRGVTTRCFRETFAEVIRGVGFTEAVTPFVSALPGRDPLRERELSGGPLPFRVTPQFIGKDPAALRGCLEKVKEAGFDTADLNCGCPFPMVRSKGRGSGLLRTPRVLRIMLETGCGVMGAGRFSVKTRLGVDRADELLDLMPVLNDFPLRFLAVHPRTARQMYGGECDIAMFERVAAAAKMPVVRNGDVPFEPGGGSCGNVMVGRSFIRYLGSRADIGALLERYISASLAEFGGERPVLGRLKELISYWRDSPGWRRRWDAVKICRSVVELRSVI